MTKQERVAVKFAVIVEILQHTLHKWFWDNL